MYQPGWPMLRLCEEALKSRTMTLKWQGHLKRGNCPDITTLFLVFVFFKLQYFCLFFCPGLTVPRHPLLSTKENYFFCSNLPDPARPVSSLVEAVLCLIWLAGLCTLLSSYLLFIVFFLNFISIFFLCLFTYLNFYIYLISRSVRAVVLLFTFHLYLYLYFSTWPDLCK